MVRQLSLTAALAFAIAASSAGVAASGPAKGCRDAAGKYVKCPATAQAKPQRCRDPQGHFTKCPARGGMASTPAPAPAAPTKK
jgi:hypothetical protein